jgi:hypothetical protein
MTDLPNCVSKQRLYFMALIIVVTLKIVTEHFGLSSSAASRLENELNKEGIL